MFPGFGLGVLAARTKVLAASLLDLGATRIELAAAELEDFVSTRIRSAACVIAAIACAALTDGLLCAAIVLSLSGPERGAALLSLAVFNAALALALVVAAQRLVRNAPPFNATIEEIRRDAHSLRAESHDPSDSRHQAEEPRHGSDTAPKTASASPPGP